MNYTKEKQRQLIEEQEQQLKETNKKYFQDLNAMGVMVFYNDEVSE